MKYKILVTISSVRDGKETSFPVVCDNDARAEILRQALAVSVRANAQVHQDFYLMRISNVYTEEE